MARRFRLAFATGLTIALFYAPAMAQEEGGCASGGGTTSSGVSTAISVSADSGGSDDHEGGGGSGSCGGDVFGDLVHVKRSPQTGQPILQKRWISYPQDVFDWGYCPIPVDKDGNEIPFASLSCDPDPAYEEALVELDYFGRLSGGRTKERNSRMHFDEAIERIKDAQVVERDAAGRIRTGSACTAAEGGGIDASTCTWRAIDSPQENLAIYHRLLRYGHIQTDPLEVNADSHGDPALPTQYHVALDASDWAKFSGSLAALLPAVPGDAAACFGAGTFTCHNQQTLTSEDFAIAASLLGAAADKTGTITADLVQYLNRILRIPKKTPEAPSTLNTLPALIRDCGADPGSQVSIYSCTVHPAPGGLPAPADERFVDYSVVQYDRTQWFSGTTDAAKPTGPDSWVRARGVVMREYLAFVNPGHQAGQNIEGFVNASLDGVRAVEFMHDYEPRADLGWDFATVFPDPAPVVLDGITSDLPAPQHVGRTIRFTAAASGGLPPLAYKWLLFDGTYWTTLSAWSTSNTVDWTPAVERPDYQVGVWVRDGTSVADAPDSAGTAASIPYSIVAGARVTSLAADRPSPQMAGTEIRFTVAADGGTAPYEYEWWLFNGTAWTVAQAWAPVSTFSWTPSVANPSYRIGVWVRSADNTVNAPEGSKSLASMAFPIGAAAPLTVTGLAANLPSPQALGSTIDFTAAASGGTAPYEFKWFVFNGAAWSVALDWTSDATFSWTPAAANPVYKIGVWARSAGDVQDAPAASTALTSIPFAVLPPP